MDSLQTIQLEPPTNRRSTSKRFTLLSRNAKRRTIWDDTPGQKTTTTTLWGTIDWSFLGASLLFILLASLAIANGSCSRPRGLLAASTACVGGELTVQAWLAIIGLEFGVLGFFVIPRIQALVTSRILTSRLMDNGLSMAKLLNRQIMGPVSTQIRHGIKSILFLKLFFLILITIFSILYKFSFYRVSRFDTIGLTTITPPVLMGCDDRGQCNGISTNLIYALSNTNTPSSFNTSFTPGTSLSAPHYEQIFGPSQVNIAYELDEGDLYLCDPTYYFRNKVVPNLPNWTPPTLGKQPYNKGVRYTYSAGSVNDVFSLNDSLLILSGVSSANGTAKYQSYLSTSIEVCLGYTFWSVNNTAGRSSFLQNPTDIACIPEPFSFTSWFNASSTQFTLGLLQGLGLKSINNLPVPTAMMNVILATLNHAISETKLGNQTAVDKIPSQCSSTTHPWVISGTIPNHGTGMTLLGIVLQGFIILLCLLSLLLIFWPTLPLLSEWPAQWFGLVYGLSGAKIQETVERTSVGRNEAGCEVKVWLGSGGGDILEGRP